LAHAGGIPLAFANDLAFLILCDVILELAAVLGTTTVKEASIPTARHPLVASAGPGDVEPFGKRKTTQSICTVI
jgi:hypothetical protein